MKVFERVISNIYLLLCFCIFPCFNQHLLCTKALMKEWEQHKKMNDDMFLISLAAVFPFCRNKWFDWLGLLINRLASIYDALRDLVTFVQFKKREKPHGGVLLLIKSKWHSSMGVFYTFKIVQIVLNRAKHQICGTSNLSSRNIDLKFTK